MFLSNPQAAAAGLLIVLLFAVGCSWLNTAAPAPDSPSAIAEPQTGLPFEVKEPETYRTDFVTIAGGVESTSRFARKSGNWRIDTFTGDKPNRSIIQSDDLVYVDHASKQYSQPPVGGPDAQPEFLSDLTGSLLSRAPRARFEKIGVDGSLERYSVTTDAADGPSTLIFDTSLGMIVRHEFQDGFAIEMRNFNLEVDDATFIVPVGYRKVPWNVFKQP